MKYLINEVEIPFEANKIIEFESDTLCKIIEASVRYSAKEGRQMLKILVMNRWGQERTALKKHKIIAMQVGVIVEHTASSEYTMSRRGSFLDLDYKKYYLFAIEK